MCLLRGHECGVRIRGISRAWSRKTCCPCRNTRSCGEEKPRNAPKNHQNRPRFTSDPPPIFPRFASLSSHLVVKERSERMDDPIGSLEHFAEGRLRLGLGGLGGRGLGGGALGCSRGELRCRGVVWCGRGGKASDMKREEKESTLVCSSRDILLEAGGCACASSDRAHAPGQKQHKHINSTHRHNTTQAQQNTTTHKHNAPSSRCCGTTRAAWACSTARGSGCSRPRCGRCRCGGGTGARRCTFPCACPAEECGQNRGGEAGERVGSGKEALACCSVSRAAGGRRESERADRKERGKTAVPSHVEKSPLFPAPPHPSIHRDPHRVLQVGARHR